MIMSSSCSSGEPSLSPMLLLTLQGQSVSGQVHMLAVAGLSGTLSLASSHPMSPRLYLPVLLAAVADAVDGLTLGGGVGAVAC